MEIGNKIKNIRDICFPVPNSLLRIASHSLICQWFLSMPPENIKVCGFLMFLEWHRKRPVVYGLTIRKLKTDSNWNKLVNSL